MTANTTTANQPNIAQHKVTWMGPIIMLASRSVLAIVVQALVYFIFYGNEKGGWNQAGEWWRVYGSVIDIFCIGLLVWLTRREGIRLFDLGKYRRQGWLREGLIGLGFSIPLLLAFAVPTIGIETLCYGSTGPVPGSNLPLIGSLYALFIWPILWSFAEDNVYFGYSLNRLETLTGKKWLAIVIMAFFMALQHIFLPFRLEWQWIVSHFMGYIIGSVAFCLLYMRWRRLLPVHVAHWGINVVGVVMVMLNTLGD